MHRSTVLLTAAATALTALAALALGTVASPGAARAATPAAAPLAAHRGRSAGRADATAALATAAQAAAAGMAGAGRVPAPALTGVPAAEDAAPRDERAEAATAAGSITLSGHGFGPGEGMGQYGAFGYASEAAYRWSWQTIVDHYYQGTHLEALSAAEDAAPIAVNLSELDDATTTPVETHRPGTTLVVDGSTLAATRMTVRHTAATQTVRATAGDISVEVSSGVWRSYQGSIEIRSTAETDGTAGQTWNIVPLEDYVAGVVPSESIASWGSVAGGENALEAQAVAARSYGLQYVQGVGRTCDTDACQVYLGDPSTQGLGAYYLDADQAAAGTVGHVMCTVAVSPCPPPDISPTGYSSSTGGYTAGAVYPAEPDAGDAVASNPYHDWTATVDQATLQDAFPGIGAVTAVRVVERNGLGQGGGRALEVEVTGASGTTEVTGTAFTADLGLDSDWFAVVPTPT